MKSRSKVLVPVTFLLAASLAVAGCSSGPTEASFDGKAPAKPSKSGPGGASATPAAPDNVQMPTNVRKWNVQRELSDGTQVMWTTLKGPKSGFEGRVWAWVPKQYKEKKYQNSAFPVLTALPGASGYPTNYWFGSDFKLQERIAQQIEEGRSLPFIVMMPVLNAKLDQYWDGSDIPNQPKMGTWMSDDVPDLARENFRTYKDPKGWGFFGSSAGGYVGMKMVLQYPDRFSTAVAGGPDTAPDSPFWKGFEEQRLANDPARLAEALAKRDGPKVHLSFLLGDKEEGAKVKAFKEKIGKGPIETDLHIIPNAGHDGYKYADGLFQGPLEWISKRMIGPVPAP
ncbi:alpha/beta hydrolase-fold protein [Streptomyces sp. NPDC029003]|uniref:alpha/beta hydrolase n=1 Tax=Streptomyces sp. NPDC029003 TaxID=3155125 RepID=UPI00340B5958